jgi:hypothetical protein
MLLDKDELKSRHMLKELSFMQILVLQKFVKIARVFGLKLFSSCSFSISLAKLSDATTNRLLVFNPLINQVFWKHQ